MSLNAEKSTEKSVNGRYIGYIGDISPIFFDFSTERFSIAKIVSLGSDIRYIANISADISEISNTVWNNLKERYDHQKTIILPKARYDWIHLRLQDYKAVSAYNSSMFHISSQLKLCGEKVTDEDMLENTFSTFHASNLLLQQQYREKDFKKYSQLISCLLVAEQNNELLMKNYEARPTGYAPFPEVNVTVYQPHNQIQGQGRGRGHGRGRGRSCRFGNRSGYSKNPSRHLKWERNEKKDQGDLNTNSVDNVCYRCGMKGHWSHTCRTSKHFVDLYKESLKRNEKRVETNFITECGTSDTQFDDFTNLDVVDFFIQP